MANSTSKPIEEEEDSRKIKRKKAPGKTIESRENQVISLAYDEAERRIKTHVASSQEITHFLKMGSKIAQLEKVKLERENELLTAKTEAIKSQKRVEDLYTNAMKAFRMYSGQDAEEEFIDDEED